MPKRKRPWIEVPNTEGPARSMKSQRTEHKLDQGKISLARAFKTARGFERQKLSRRQKTAQSKSDEKDVARINAEIEALKTLDLNTVATNYLIKSLLKIKAIAISPDLPEDLTKEVKQLSDPASLNVIARLCKSNPVRDALAPAVKDVQAALGLDATSTSDTTKSDRKSSSKGTDAAKRATAPAEDSNADPSNEEDFEGFSDSDSHAIRSVLSQAMRQNGDNEDDDDSEDINELASFDARLASSSDSEWDSDTALSSRSKVDPRTLLSMQGTPSPGSSRSPSPSPRKGTSSPPSRPSRSPYPPPQARSSFLPSLSMSGYIPASDSGSEPDLELDSDAGFSTSKTNAAGKKNRRGQRARQAIWEKKFGAGAKHVATPSTDGAAKAKRDEGWDARRGATEGAAATPRGGGFRGRAGRGGAAGRGGRGGGAGRGGRDRGAPAPRDGANAVPVGKRKTRDDQGPLHPSWAAAKKRKEAGPGATAFKGKKVTFD